VDEREHDFEFDFFPDRPASATAEEDEELLWEESRDDPPARRSAAPTGPQVVMRRRIAAGAAVALLLLIIIIVVVTSSGGGGGGGSYRGYVNDVSPIASDSQQAGAALSGVSGKDAISKVDTLIQQTVDDVTRLQALNPPSTLQGVQSQALAALDLRLTGLQGIRSTIVQAQAGASGSWDSAVSTQVDDLVASDVIWSRAVRNQANGVLEAHGLGGVFPGSTFVGDRSSLLKSLRALLGATTGGSTNAAVLKVGDTGQDVVAWQNQLNQWLQKTGSTQTVTADGNFGATTQTVTEQLQTAAGLSPDGIVGASTRQALQQALSGTKTGSTGGTTTPSTISTARALKLGDTGQDVVEWQTQLNQWLNLTAPGATPLVTDGSFGAGTQTATEQLQTQAGLTPTGQVDAATRNALTQAIANASPNRG
jgi:peptidoglycan hydrolase-like protein with peptidoglycan-binding domain